MLIGWLAAQGVPLANDASDQTIVAAVQKAAARNASEITSLANDKDTLAGKSLALENELATTKTALANAQDALTFSHKNACAFAVDLVIQKGKLAVSGRAAAIAALENATDFAAELKKLDDAAPVVKTAADAVAGKSQSALENEQAKTAEEYDCAIKSEMAGGKSITQAHKAIMTLPKYQGLALKLVPATK